MDIPTGITSSAASFDRALLPERLRVYALAKLMGVTTRDLVVALDVIGSLKVAQSTLTNAEAQELLDQLSRRGDASATPAITIDAPTTDAVATLDAGDSDVVKSDSPVSDDAPSTDAAAATPAPKRTAKRAAKAGPSAAAEGESSTDASAPQKPARRRGRPTNAERAARAAAEAAAAAAAEVAEPKVAEAVADSAVAKADSSSVAADSSVSTEAGAAEVPVVKKAARRRGRPTNAERAARAAAEAAAAAAAAGAESAESKVAEAVADSATAKADSSASAEAGAADSSGSSEAGAAEAPVVKKAARRRGRPTNAERAARAAAEAAVAAAAAEVAEPKAAEAVADTDSSGSSEVGVAEVPVVKKAARRRGRPTNAERAARAAAEAAAAAGSTEAAVQGLDAEAEAKLRERVRKNVANEVHQIEEQVEAKLASFQANAEAGEPTSETAAGNSGAGNSDSAAAPEEQAVVTRGRRSRARRQVQDVVEASAGEGSASVGSEAATEAEMAEFSGEFDVAVQLTDSDIAAMAAPRKRGRGTRRAKNEVVAEASADAGAAGDAGSVGGGSGEGASAQGAAASAGSDAAAVRSARPTFIAPVFIPPVVRETPARLADELDDVDEGSVVNVADARVNAEASDSEAQPVRRGRRGRRRAAADAAAAKAEAAVEQAVDTESDDAGAYSAGTAGAESAEAEVKAGRRSRRGARKAARGAGETLAEREMSIADAAVAAVLAADEERGISPDDAPRKGAGKAARAGRGDSSRKAGRETSSEKTPAEETAAMLGQEEDAAPEVEVIDRPRGITGSTRQEAMRRRRQELQVENRKRKHIISEAEFLARRESVTRTMLVQEAERHDGAGTVTQVAVLEDGILVENIVTSESQKSLVGNIYMGQVQNVVTGMEAVFIDIGTGRNGVLYSADVNWRELKNSRSTGRKMERHFNVGDLVMVQVVKDSVGHKGPRLSTNINLPGRYLVYLPQGSGQGISRKLPEPERKRLKKVLREVTTANAGTIVRTAAEGVSDLEISADVQRLQTQWEQIAQDAAVAQEAEAKQPVALYEEPDRLIKIIRDQFNEDFTELIIEGARPWTVVSKYIRSVAPDLDSRLVHFLPRGGEGKGELFRRHRVDEQIEKALSRIVYLPSGGSLVIDHTEAMTVIDVNTGRYTGAGASLEETVTINNLEAAEEIARQLRLRDIGGMIVVDFIDMVLPENRDLVVRRLTESMGRDRTLHNVGEVTSLGLVQITRKRQGEGLLALYSTRCEHCHGRGVVVHEDPVEFLAQPTHLDEERDQGRPRSRGEKSSLIDAPSSRRSGSRDVERDSAKPARKSKGKNRSLKEEATASVAEGLLPAPDSGAGFSEDDIAGLADAVVVIDHAEADDSQQEKPHASRTSIRERRQRRSKSAVGKTKLEDSGLVLIEDEPEGELDDLVDAVVPAADAKPAKAKAKGKSKKSKADKTKADKAKTDNSKADKSKAEQANSEQASAAEDTVAAVRVEGESSSKNPVVPADQLSAAAAEFEASPRRRRRVRGNSVSDYPPVAEGAQSAPATSPSEKTSEEERPVARRRRRTAASAVNAESAAPAPAADQAEAPAEAPATDAPVVAVKRRGRRRVAAQAVLSQSAEATPVAEAQAPATGEAPAEQAPESASQDSAGRGRARTRRRRAVAVEVASVNAPLDDAQAAEASEEQSTAPEGEVTVRRRSSGVARRRRGSSRSS